MQNRWIPININGHPVEQRFARIDAKAIEYLFLHENQVTFLIQILHPGLGYHKAP